MYYVLVKSLQPNSTVKFGGLTGVLINFRYGQSMAEAHVLKASVVRVSFSILTPYVYLLVFSATSELRDRNTMVGFLLICHFCRSS
jgi:hypothetical protein